MHVYTKLDEIVVALLCCPFCKGTLKLQLSQFVCSICRSTYPLVDAAGGKVYDFRIYRPAYLMPQSIEKWSKIQREYEDYDSHFAKLDIMSDYLDEIDSVREIYTAEFHIAGRVLDVGGHQGRLRHYLNDIEVPVYVSVDPFIDVFRYAQKPNLLKAYACLSLPCNFLACHAENIPFIAQSFDWIHMRSVVDHFADPFLALKEAYRVLKPNGQVLIGLSIVERITMSRQNVMQRILQKLRRQGVSLTFKNILYKLMHIYQLEHDDHNIRLKYKELLDLISRTGFSVSKEHWQKPPYTHVIYVLAKKIPLD